MAVPACKRNVAPGERALGQHRVRNGVYLHGFFVAVEVVAEHHRTILDAGCEQSIEIESAAQLLVHRLERARVLQFLLRQRVQHLHARACVALGPDDVEADHRHAILVEQLVHQARHDVAAPGPAPDLAQALLVDVEDDNARVTLAGHGQLQPRVINDVVELMDEPDFVDPGGVPDEEDGDRQAKDDPYEVLLHLFLLRTSRAGGPAAAISS